MKSLNTLLSLLAIASVAVVSCKQKEAPYTPGAPEDSDCYGVYFPTQAIPSELDPAAELELTIAVSRTNAKDAITVPLVVKQEEDVFEFGELKFDNGQEETTLTVKFPKMTELNQEYSCTVSIEDPKYAKLYGSTTTDLAINISRVKWNDLEYTDPETGKKITEAIYVDDILSTFFGVGNPVIQVKAQEHSQIPGYYRIESPYCENYPYNDPGDWDDSKPYYIYIHAEDPEFVWIPQQETGLDWSYGSMRIWSNAGYNIENKGNTIEEAKQLGGGGTLFKGVITFPVNGLLINMPGISASWYYANKDGKFEIIFPGGIEVDYSYAVEQEGFSTDGQIPVSFSLGADIEYIKYNTYEGILSGEELDAALAETIADNSLPKVTETSVVGISFEETGVYTLLYVVVDSEGEKQGSDAITLYYQAEGDEQEVEVYPALSSISFQDILDGINPENNLAFMIKGANLTDVKYAAFKYIDILSDAKKVQETIKGAESVPSKDLNKINGDGLVGTISGLVPGTQYVLVVYASNGYSEDYFISEQATTDGDPLPIYLDYTVGDYYGAGAFESRQKAIGTWNYYATDYYGTLGMREYIGKVKITASETETEGPDDDGLYDEYVYVDGLFGDLSWLANYGMSTDAVLEMDVYDGIIYHFNETTVDGKYLIYMQAKARGEWGYKVSYCGAFIPVADGYYAFVDVSRYAASYNFCGMGLYDSDGGWIARMEDLLLVDPEKDDNGVAPAAAKASKHLFQETVKNHKENFVETEKGRIQSIIDEYRNAAPRTQGKVNTDVTLHFPLRQAKMTCSTMEAQPRKVSKELKTNLVIAF